MEDLKELAASALPASSCCVVVALSDMAVLIVLPRELTLGVGWGGVIFVRSMGGGAGPLCQW